MIIIKHDIQSKKDIKLMVDSFYDKVNNNNRLSYVFNDFSKINWDEHLPKMYGFWNTLIFGEKDYKGNPFALHINLPVQKEHFDEWIALFEVNIDELFKRKNSRSNKTKSKINY